MPPRRKRPRIIEHSESEGIVQGNTLHSHISVRSGRSLSRIRNVVHINTDRRLSHSPSPGPSSPVSGPDVSMNPMLHVHAPNPDHPNLSPPDSPDFSQDSVLRIVDGGHSPRKKRQRQPREKVFFLHVMLCSWLTFLARKCISMSWKLSSLSAIQSSMKCFAMRALATMTWDGPVARAMRSHLSISNAMIVQV